MSIQGGGSMDDGIDNRNVSKDGLNPSTSID